MKIRQTVVLFVGWLLSPGASLNSSSEDIPQRCGSCWCITGSNETCPSYSPGITAVFSSSVYAAYSSFELLSTPLTLATSSGDTNCYPFADLLGSGGLEGFPESTYPQCAAPNSTNATVCAYKFQTFNVSCQGRSYDLNTYSSSEAAATDGASVVHSGACGVCSNAHDLSLRMESGGRISSEAYLCGVNYVLGGGGFSKLQSCFETIGFTSSCAVLWAHYTATSSFACISTCTLGANLNSSEPPLCDLSPCLNCSKPFGAEARLFGGLGISVSNAGILEDTPRPCSAFTRITFDPCAGAEAFNGTLAPRRTSGAVLPVFSSMIMGCLSFGLVFLF